MRLYLISPKTNGGNQFDCSGYNKVHFHALTIYRTYRSTQLVQAVGFLKRTAVNAMEGVNSSPRITVKCQKQPSANINGMEFLQPKLSMILSYKIVNTLVNSTESISSFQHLTWGVANGWVYLEVEYLLLVLELPHPDIQNSFLKASFPSHGLQIKVSDVTINPWQWNKLATLIIRMAPRN